MNKSQEIIRVFLSCILVTVIYAILHDQIAFSVSSDFFYRYSFYQFGVANEGQLWIPEFPRLEILKLSFLTSWWIGTIIGFIYCFVGFSDRSKKLVFSDFYATLILSFAITTTTSIIGAIIGGFINLSKVQSSIPYEIDSNLIIQRHFLIASYMDKFSYLGAIFAAINIYKIRKNKPA